MRAVVAAVAIVVTAHRRAPAAACEAMMIGEAATVAIMTGAATAVMTTDHRLLPLTTRSHRAAGVEFRDPNPWMAVTSGDTEIPVRPGVV